VTDSAASPTIRSRALTIAGIALIVGPIVAAAIKFASFGWLMILWIWMLYPPVLLLLGWALQIVIASTGYFGRRAPFALHGRSRAVAAAWTTIAGLLLIAFFLVDGADTSWGSTFMYLTGTASDDTAGAVSTTIATIALVPWLGGWLWLLAEWIVALVRRARVRRRG